MEFFFGFITGFMVAACIACFLVFGFIDKIYKNM